MQKILLIVMDVEVEGLLDVGFEVGVLLVDVESVIGAGLESSVRTEGREGEIRIGACVEELVDDEDGGGVRNVLVGLVPLAFLSRCFVCEENSCSDHSPF